MIDRAVDLLLKRSEMRIRVSCNLRDNMRRCVESSMKAIVKSRQLLASSEALLSYPEYHMEPDTGSVLSSCKSIEEPATASLPVVSKRDFGCELILTDGKHFCECGFRSCTLLYSGFPVTFESCQFHDCRFEFCGAAGRTVQFLECFGLLTKRSTEPAGGDSVDAPIPFIN